MDSMKRYPEALLARLLFVALFLSNSIIAIAQVRIGGEAGINVATLSVSSPDFYWDDSKISSYVGPAIGGMVQADLSGPVFLRIEPMYIQKGTTIRIDYEIASGFTQIIERPFKLEFLELPVYLGVQVGNGSLRPYFFAGPDLGYMLTRGYSRVDFALDLGLGGEYALSPAFSILLDVRYSAGLNNLNSEDAGAPELRSRGVQPLVGVLFQP
jgi:hypothetical protein